MLPIILIILAAILLVATIILIVVINAKRNERIKYNIAAGNTLREEYLNHSLRNDVYSESNHKPGSIKLMIYLKTKYGKQKIRYVFNPENRILIGRDKYESNIYVNDKTVSKKHCCIYLSGGQVYLEDMNAANGTVVERGLFKNYKIVANNRIILRSRDRVIVGSSIIKVILFYYDMSTM